MFFLNGLMIISLICLANILSVNICKAGDIPENIYALANKLTKESAPPIMRFKAYAEALKATPWGSIDYPRAKQALHDEKAVVDFLTSDEFTFGFETLDSVLAIETLLALSKCGDLVDLSDAEKQKFKSRFSQMLVAIRYQVNKGHLEGYDKSFLGRLHFPSKDWLPANATRGHCEDITKDVAGTACMGTGCFIDTANWVLTTQPDVQDYLKRKESEANQDAVKRRIIEEMGKRGYPVEATWVSFDYISIDDYLASPERFNENFPEVGILSMVAPFRTKVFEIIGTKMNVCTQNIFVRKENHIYVQHTRIPEGSELKLVSEILLEDYLKHFHNDHAIKGFNIARVLL